MYTPYTMTTRPRLSRERILEDALRIVDTEGLGGLTIRRLAQELDVTPMAVYRHFKNKGDILDGLIELVIAEGKATEHDTPGWQAWIEVTFMRMRASLLHHPGVLPLLGSSASYGLQSLRITEQKFDFLLNPVQAQVEIGLAIAADPPADDTVARGALGYSQSVKDAQAALNLVKAVELVADMIPF